MYLAFCPVSWTWANSGVCLPGASLKPLFVPWTSACRPAILLQAAWGKNVKISKGGSSNSNTKPIGNSNPSSQISKGGSSNTKSIENSNPPILNQLETRIQSQNKPSRNTKSIKTQQIYEQYFEIRNQVGRTIWGGKLFEGGRLLVRGRHSSPFPTHVKGIALPTLTVQFNMGAKQGSIIQKQIPLTWLVCLCRMKPGSRSLGLGVLFKTSIELTK